MYILDITAKTFLKTAIFKFIFVQLSIMLLINIFGSMRSFYELGKAQIFKIYCTMKSTLKS